KWCAQRLKGTLPAAVEFDDLVSAGVFGLISAIAAFDPERGVKFENYCVLPIRGAMLDELRRVDWVPRTVRGKETALRRLGEALERALGRPPISEEASYVLDCSAEEYEQLAADASPRQQMSLQEKWYETDSFKDVCPIHILTDPRAE